MSHFRYDATLKSIVAEHLPDFAEMLRFAPDEPTTLLNVDLSTLSAATDTAIGFGNPLERILDVNFQTGPDADLPRRLHLYSAAFHLRYKVPVHSVLVLLHPRAALKNLTGLLEYPSGNDADRVQFPYRLVRIWQEPLEPYLQGGVGLLPLASLCRLPDDDSLPEALRKVVCEIDRRLATEVEPAMAMTLMTATEILARLRVESRHIERIFGGLRTMSDTTFYEMILEEGRMVGRIGQSQQVLLRQGRLKFGQADARTQTELEAINDLDRLERMSDAILTSNTWQELLTTP